MVQVVQVCSGKTRLGEMSSIDMPETHADIYLSTRTHARSRASPRWAVVRIPRGGMSQGNANRVDYPPTSGRKLSAAGGMPGGRAAV